MKKFLSILLAVFFAVSTVLPARAEQHVYTYRVEFKANNNACWSSGVIYDNSGGQIGIDPRLGLIYTMPEGFSLVLSQSGNYDCCAPGHPDIVEGFTWQQISVDGGPWQDLSPTFIPVKLYPGSMSTWYVVANGHLTAGVRLTGCPY